MRSEFLTFALSLGCALVGCGKPASVELDVTPAPGEDKATAYIVMLDFSGDTRLVADESGAFRTTLYPYAYDSQQAGITIWPQRSGEDCVREPGSFEPRPRRCFPPLDRQTHTFTLYGEGPTFLHYDSATDTLTQDER